MIVVQDNLHLLRQALELVRACTDTCFTATRPPCYGSGIGPHLRHCLDHYHAFLAGYADGTINYDTRDREVELEQQTARAETFIEDLLTGLEAVATEDPDQTVSVFMDCGEDCGRSATSTLRRELQFLVSHTVHHFAIIAMILHDQEQPVPQDFGVAPSTLKYRQGPAACAR